MLKKTLILLMLMAFTGSAVSQEKNKALVYTDFGGHTLYGFNMGLSGLYTRTLSDRWEVTGGLNFSSRRPAFFNAIMGDATYRIPVKTFNVYLSGRMMYTYYSDSKMNDLLWRVAAKWESKYFDLVLGNSVVHTFSMGSSFTEWWVPSLGVFARLKPIHHPWNVGVHLRNYDDFFYENFNLNYGLNGYYNLNDQWGIMSEITIAPAGTLSQLATPYKFYIKLGATYKW